mmetsp:Transcript_22934/g.48823  ORF Transcript_22934/g.48823 Transcript_22934/m.48823 type:complete len:90 (+) Transcript_22934:1664-1933(+)
MSTTEIFSLGGGSGMELVIGVPHMDAAVMCADVDDTPVVPSDSTPVFDDGLSNQIDNGNSTDEGSLTNIARVTQKLYKPNSVVDIINAK